MGFSRVFSGAGARAYDTRETEIYARLIDGITPKRCATRRALSHRRCVLSNSKLPRTVAAKIKRKQKIGRKNLATAPRYPKSTHISHSSCVSGARVHCFLSLRGNMVRSVSKVTIKIHAINHAAIKNCQPDGARSAVGMNMKNFFLARLIKKNFANPGHWKWKKAWHQVNCW